MWAKGWTAVESTLGWDQFSGNHSQTKKWINIWVLGKCWQLSRFEGELSRVGVRIAKTFIALTIFSRNLCPEMIVLIVWTSEAVND